jgi:putative Mg2+ transporter-C (MgtC) family protein
MDIGIFILRLLAAMAAGFLIGLERQIHRKVAGIRTNALVAMGSAMFVMISIQVTETSGGDVTRIMGQIVTGIGFLGAGVILHQGMNIQGLATAATIWCSSAIGCLAASGFYLETLVCTVAVVLANLVFLRIEDKIKKPDPGE